MTNTNGIFEELRKSYNDNELIQRISITSCKLYNRSANGTCGGKNIYRTPAYTLIQENPEGTFHSDYYVNCWIIIDLKNQQLKHQRDLGKK